jgi:histidine ammonia-lyase
VIYGVTTGYGDSCVVAVPLHHVEALPRHLYTFHGCGLGKLLDAQATRAVLAARLQSLCHGVSGARGTAGAPACLPRTRHPAADPGRRLGGRQR